jgi:hypothetical protein
MRRIDSNCFKDCKANWRACGVNMFLVIFDKFIQGFDNLDGTTSDTMGGKEEHSI